MLNIPLMSNNINEDDKRAMIEFISSSDRFTNGPKVREFEKEWSNWLGGNYQSVMVSSGSSANYITMAALHEKYGDGEVILSPIGWTSGPCAVISAGFVPVFADVNLNNLALNVDDVETKITENTKVILLTHVLGYNGISERLLQICREKGIVLIEDTCESHGAEYNGQKCGSFADISNFSFYYAHHMSTIEGGMICTKDKELYRLMRMIRSHGMLRECDDPEYIEDTVNRYPEVHREFIFTVPGFNMRSTEINAVIGLNQLKRLDDNVKIRRENYKLFITNLDSEKYYTDFLNEGNSNYAFVVMPGHGNRVLYDRMINMFAEEKVEFRRGTAGGGNMTRQPYIRKRFPDINPADYKNAEYIHEFGVYIGNYPGLEREKILELCQKLNAL